MHSRAGKAAVKMPKLLWDLTSSSRSPTRAAKRCGMQRLQGAHGDGDTGTSWCHPCPGVGTTHEPSTPREEAAPERGSPTPGSQHRARCRAVPRRPLLLAREVLRAALCSYLHAAVINSQWLAAATRGGRFRPPATLQRQGLICLKHTPQPFHGDPFQFHGARAALTGVAKARLIYGSAFQSLPLPSRHSGRLLGETARCEPCTESPVQLLC